MNWLTSVLNIREIIYNIEERVDIFELHNLLIETLIKGKSDWVA